MADYTYGIGQELQFNTTTPDLIHTWDFGDATPIVSDPIPTHIYTSVGTYTIIHGARDFCGLCTSISHIVDIVQASITIRSILLDNYTAKVGDIVTATIIAQNLSPIFGTGTIVLRFDDEVVGTFNATLEPNQEVSFDASKQVTTSGTINVCADNVCTVLFVESQVSVKSITLDTNISTGNPITATIEVQNLGTFTEDKTIQTTLTNIVTAVIDERTVTVPPGTITYQVPVTITGLSNGVYTLCAENICRAISVAIPTETNGRLSISSNPTGAEIFVDGPSTGQLTNSAVTTLAPGDHTFTLKLAGYDDTTGSFSITAGITTYVYTILSPSVPTAGSVNISSTPPGATIEIDGIQQFDINDQPLLTDSTIGATIDGLLPTSHNITLKLYGHIDYNKTIDIVAGQKKYLDTTLTQAPILIGSIGFTTNPDGASIFIDDNEQIGILTPTTITDISIGPHSFTLTYPGRNDASGTVDVTGGATSYVYVDMTLTPPVDGNIDISSDPPGATVDINGFQQFDIYSQPILTPTIITGLPQADYDITLKLFDYIDYNKTMSIISGQTTYLSASLTRVPISTGSINFVTVPDGAGIFIDNNEQIGRLTPTAITDVSIGPHSFTLTYPGRNDASGTVDVTGGATSYVYVNMTETPMAEGGISISSDPSGATIEIDNTPQLDINSQPLTTPATITGLSTTTNHNITLKLPGYIDYNKTIDIISGQITYISASLMQAPILIGSVNFTTTPDGASIFIDNHEQINKFTPSTITNVPIGPHSFTLKYTGRNDATGVIDIVGGMISYVYVNMSIVSPTEGSLSISSIPQNADIYIGNILQPTKTPTTIDNLVPNIYTIILKKPGYNDYTTTINIIAGQTISINTTLIPTTTVVGLEFPWWLVLGIAVGMFQTGKYKEMKDIEGAVSSVSQSDKNMYNPKLLKNKVVTLTKSEYKVK